MSDSVQDLHVICTFQYLLNAYFIGCFFFLLMIREMDLYARSKHVPPEFSVLIDEQIKEKKENRGKEEVRRQACAAHTDMDI